MFFDWILKTLNLSRNWLWGGSCVCKHVYYICTWMESGRQKPNVRAVTEILSTLYFEIVSHCARSSPTRPRWLVCEPRGAYFLCLPGTRIIGSCHHAQLFTWTLGMELGSSGLYLKHFIHRAISLAQEAAIELNSGGSSVSKVMDLFEQ